MDDPAIGREEHLHALDGLARINRLSFASVPIARAIRRVGLALGRPVRVVDVAAGSGDVVLDAVRRSGVPAEILATDVSETALQAAGERASGLGVRIETRRVDAIREALPECDLSVCTLFLHHLSRDDAATVLRRMLNAGSCGGIVSDLRRGWWGTALAAVVPGLLTRSRVVRVDALRSARAAWSIGEMRGLLQEAGVGGAGVRAAFPSRMVVEWSGGAG